MKIEADARLEEKKMDHEFQASKMKMKIKAEQNARTRREKRRANRKVVTAVGKCKSAFKIINCAKVKAMSLCEETIET